MCTKYTCLLYCLTAFLLGDSARAQDSTDTPGDDAASVAGKFSYSTLLIIN